MRGRRILLPVFAGLGVLIALAMAADPYRLFGTGVTEQKPRLYRQAVMAKTYALERANPRTLLLGGLPAQSGLDPQSPVWPADARPVFNAALEGGDLFLASRLLDETIAGGSVKTVLVALDFRAFLQPPTPATDMPPVSADERRLKQDRAGRPNRYRLLQLGLDRIGAILSPVAILDSVYTLADQRGGTLTPRGFDPTRAQTGDLFAGSIAQQRQALSAAPRPDFLALYDNAEFRALKRIMQQTRRHGIRLVLFIPPCHARWLDLVQQIGLWPWFEDWKRALVHALALEKGGGEDVLLMDFSGYHPDADATRGTWNAVPFKPALGDEILKRLVLEQGSFGEVLTPETVEVALARERQGRAP